MGHLVQHPHLWKFGFPKWVAWLAMFTGNPASDYFEHQKPCLCTILGKFPANVWCNWHGHFSLAAACSLPPQNVALALQDLVQVESKLNLFSSLVLLSLAIHIRKHFLLCCLEYLNVKNNCKWPWLIPSLVPVETPFAVFAVHPHTHGAG